jgi:predicted DsbA family dithiol-disulfide isomerase
VAVAAKAGRLNSKRLRARAESRQVAARVAASTAEFHSHRISQRPAFILQDAIGDKTVFSGLVRIEPLAAAVETMLRDTAAYAAHAAHHPPAPKS